MTKRTRYESFGGIIANDDPPFLAFVDREYMREQGFEGSPLWRSNDEVIGRLSAPTEVHFAATNRCPNECPHCYMDSGQADCDEMDTVTFKKALAELAGMGVFHVALGGGEALMRDDLFELADFCREVGLVPNLTISGSMLDPQLARRLQVFGQVNVSLDGVERVSGVFRGQSNFTDADRALRMLLDANVPCGINCVVGNPNFDGIPDLVAYVSDLGLNEVEFLRLKPSGRGLVVYAEQKTTDEQNRELIPMLERLTLQYKIRCKIDCSFVPMLCWHKPSIELLEKSATYGCEAGNVLLGARSDGRVSGCSFLKTGAQHINDLAAGWNVEQDYNRLVSWRDDAPDPCRECDYLNICNGGCHAVAEAVTGNINNPDPDCPFVRASSGDMPPERP